MRRRRSASGSGMTSSRCSVDTCGPAGLWGRSPAGPHTNVNQPTWRGLPVPDLRNLGAVMQLTSRTGFQVSALSVASRLQIEKTAVQGTQMVPS